MFARILWFQFNIDKLDEAVKQYEDRILPAMKSQKGYHGAYMLSNRKTGKGVSMTIWDGEEDAVADEQSGQLQERSSWFKDFFTTTPAREGYKVSAQS